MPLRFDEDGISFQYPENWTLEREESNSGWVVSVQSPATAFLLFSFDRDKPESAEMAKTALEAMRAEYPELEADDCTEKIAGQPAIGYDIQFFSMDLTNTCSMRSFATGAGSMLLMWQANDLELENTEPVLKAIIASLKIR